MKKVMLGLFLVFLLLFPVFSADTATGSITLSGGVAKQFSVTPSATTYSFVNAGAADAVLCNLKIVSNYSAGFSIAFTSNTGDFSMNGTTTPWNYTLKLTDDFSLPPVTVPVIYNTPLTFTGRKHPGTGHGYPLLITYSGDSALDYGTYASVLTVTITSL